MNPFLNKINYQIKTARAINWSNPITKRLRGAFVPSVGGGIHEIVRGVRSTQNGTAPSYVSGSFYGRGLYYEQSGGADQAYYVDGPGNTTEVSIVILTRPRVNSGLALAAFSDIGTSNRAVLVPEGSGTHFQLRATNTATVSLTGATQFTWGVTLNPVLVGVSISGATDRRLYVYGKRDGTDTSTQDIFTAQSSTGLKRISVGSRWNGSSWGSAQEQDIFLAYFWDRALTDAEHYSLYLNPWQLFQPNHNKYMAHLPIIDFPASPALNDIYTFSGNSWKWNGTSWCTYY